MKSASKVRVPPAVSVMVFDGQCGFCRFWIQRWKHITGSSVDYLPFQDPLVFVRFPEIPRAACEKSVQFIDSDGTIYEGAEAVYRSLATCPKMRWPLWIYLRIPGAGLLSEWCYRFVAAHRQKFSSLTRFLFGRRAQDY